MTITSAPLPQIDDATRREFLAMLGAAGLLAACGNDDAETTSGATPATRKVDGAFGPVEVPTEAARVFVADFSDAEAALVLGVTPLARWRYDSRPAPGHLRRWSEEAATIEGPDGFNLEQLAALGPDLVLTPDYYAEPVLEPLGRIAPVAAYRGDDQDPFSGDWKEHLRFVADVLGRGERAEELLGEWGDRAGRFGEAVAEAGLGPVGELVVSVLRYDGASFSAYLRSSFSGAVLGDLGVARPVGQDLDTPGSSAIDLGLEELGQADGDLIVVFASGEEVTSQAGLDALRSSPLGPTLDAVRRDRALTADPGHWFYGSIDAAHLVLEDLAGALSITVER